MAYSFIALFLFSMAVSTKAFAPPFSTGHERPTQLPTLSATSTDGTSSNRRQVLVQTSASFLLPFLVAASPAHAKPPPIPVDKALEKVRFELNDPEGGVAYMQTCITNQDYNALLEFTKTYDQVLRKGAMGAAKKGLEGDTTTLANAVTFDLIGINRSSRPGQTSQEQAQKYLDELKRDVNAFLALDLKPVEE